MRLQSCSASSHVWLSVSLACLPACRLRLPLPRQVLDTYKPIVWEYSRLNVTNNVMSKRKLNKLVTGACLQTPTLASSCHALNPAVPTCTASRRKCFSKCCQWRRLGGCWTNTSSACHPVPHQYSCIRGAGASVALGVKVSYLCRPSTASDLSLLLSVLV